MRKSQSVSCELQLQLEKQSAHLQMEARRADQRLSEKLKECEIQESLLQRKDAEKEALQCDLSRSRQFSLRCALTAFVHLKRKNRAAAAAAAAAAAVATAAACPPAKETRDVHVNTEPLGASEDEMRLQAEVEALRAKLAQSEEARAKAESKLARARRGPVPPGCLVEEPADPRTVLRELLEAIKSQSSQFAALQQRVQEGLAAMPPT